MPTRTSSFPRFFGQASPVRSVGEGEQFAAGAEIQSDVDLRLVGGAAVGVLQSEDWIELQRRITRADGLADVSTPRTQLPQLSVRSCWPGATEIVVCGS